MPHVCKVSQSTNSTFRSLLGLGLGLSRSELNEKRSMFHTLLAFPLNHRITFNQLIVIYNREARYSLDVSFLSIRPDSAQSRVRAYW